MKGLEALEHIKECVKWCAYDGKNTGIYEKDFTTIEKELKALEIIRECNLFERITSGQVDVHYWFTLVSKEVDKKDLDLLKEVLKNE